MNMAEKLDAIADILCNKDLCAEAMVAEIGEIVYDDEDDSPDGGNIAPKEEEKTTTTKEEKIEKIRKILLDFGLKPIEEVVF